MLFTTNPKSILAMNYTKVVMYFTTNLNNYKKLVKLFITA